MSLYCYRVRVRNNEQHFLCSKHIRSVYVVLRVCTDDNTVVGRGVCVDDAQPRLDMRSVEYFFVCIYVGKSKTCVKRMCAEDVSPVNRSRGTSPDIGRSFGAFNRPLWTQ